MKVVCLIGDIQKAETFEWRMVRVRMNASIILSSEMIGVEREEQLGMDYRGGKGLYCMRNVIVASNLMDLA